MDDLDALVRRVDEDRWLASRFAPVDARQRLIALYAVNYEIARTAETVREPALGDIRLTWWRDALAEVHAKRPARAQPSVAAYAAAHPQTPFDIALWDTLIEARRKDFEAQPFESTSAFDCYVDATAGGVMRLAVQAGGVEQASIAPQLNLAAWVWGATGLLRTAAIQRARGREVLAESEAELAARIEHALAELRTLPPMPSLAFPALGYVSLAASHLRTHQRGASTSLLARQLKLVGASLTGRF